MTKITQMPKSLSKLDQRRFQFDLLDCLASPIIIFNSAWKNDIPKEILSDIKMYRMLSYMANEKTATDLEVFIYLYPRTMEAPMPREWTDIYTWLGAQYFTRTKKYQPKDFEDIAPKELTQYQIRLFKGSKI